MSLGIPVVTFDVGSVSEIVDHGKTGYVVPVFDVSAVARHTIHLAKEPILRKKMCGESEMSARKRFTARHCAKHHYQCYRYVMDGSNKKKLRI
jgi:glycosyltransferase involved in cell wall biosynthesis